MHADPRLVALRFSDRINARDAAGLAGLMSEHHRLIDRAGTVVSGKDAVTAAWVDFFEAFPEYRNVIVKTRSSGNTAALLGHALWDGNAAPDRVIWVATVDDALVAEWRILDDTRETRKLWRLDP